MAKKVKGLKFQHLTEEFFHPAPSLSVILSKPHESSNSVKTDATIDTGADLCFLPQKIINELGLPMIDIDEMTDFQGNRVEVYFYSAQITIDNIGTYVEKIGNTNDDDVLIGRSIINTLNININGPELYTEIIT